MFATLTYKKKLKALGAAAIVGLLLCYALAIRRTVAEVGKYSQSADMGNGAAASTGMEQLKTRNGEVEALYTRYVLDTLRSEKNLLSVASNYCKSNHLELKEYKPISFSKSDSTQLLTRVVTVQGGFVPCLKFLHELETGANAGRVSAAEFKSYPDPQDKRLKLDCTIYIQNLIPN